MRAQHAPTPQRKNEDYNYGEQNVCASAGRSWAIWQSNKSVITTHNERDRQTDNATAQQFHSHKTETNEERRERVVNTLCCCCRFLFRHGHKRVVAVVEKMRKRCLNQSSAGTGGNRAFKQSGRRQQATKTTLFHWKKGPQKSVSLLLLPL